MLKAWTAFWAGRKRRQEKSRRAQELESTFPERLASRSSSKKTNSKIDLGFTSQANLNSDLGSTSQPNLNSDLENEKRRPTFSKFLQLWKGLRNSKRKSNNEETRRSVVFTIPTEDIFTKSEPTEQTQRVASQNHDHVIHMEGFVTHLCDVHRVNEEPDNYDKYDVHHLSDQNMNTSEENKHEIKEETSIQDISKMTAETTRNQNEFSCSISSNHIPEQVKLPGNLSSESVGVLGHNGRLDDDIYTTKENDVENDSGCGSSCHEIACPESSMHGYVPLSVKTLDHNSCLAQCHHSTTQVTHNNNNNKAKHYISDDERSQQQLKRRTQTEEDSFEALIQLAKLGMSNDARQEVFKYFDNEEGSAKKSSFSDNTETGDNLNEFNGSQVTKNFDDDIQTHERLEINPSTYDTECGTSMVFTTNSHQVDSGVKLSSTNSLLINDNDRKNEALLRRLTKQTADDKNAEGFASNAATMPTTEAKDHETNFCKNKTNEFHSKKIQERKQRQVSFESSRTSAEHSHNCLSEMKFDESSESFHDSSRAVTESKYISRSAKSLPSLRQSPTTAKNGSKKTTEAKEIITSEKTSAKNLYNLKVPSFETLHLPSHTPSEDQDKRIRSFSATIRRKFSFRDRQSSDDMNVVPCSPEQDMLKSKKIKTFRSFRVHKKNKASSLDARNGRGLDSGDTKGYQSMFDKILSEDTGSAVFSDVPFTIPEIYD